MKESTIEEYEEVLKLAQGASDAFTLAVLPCGVVVRLLRHKDGSGFALTARSAESVSLMADYWPVFKHGSWEVSDISEPDGSVTTIKGLTVQRVVDYMQKDADRHGLLLDRAELESALSSEAMERVSLAADVLIS